MKKGEDKGGLPPLYKPPRANKGNRRVQPVDLGPSIFPSFTEEELRSPVKLIVKICVMSLFLPLFITKFVVDLMVAAATGVIQQVPALAEYMYNHVVIPITSLLYRTIKVVTGYIYQGVTQAGRVVLVWADKAARWYITTCLTVAHKAWDLLCEAVPLVWSWVTAPAMWVWAWAQDNVLSPATAYLWDKYSFHRDNTLPWAIGTIKHKVQEVIDGIKEVLEALWLGGSKSGDGVDEKSVPPPPPSSTTISTTTTSTTTGKEGTSSSKESPSTMVVESTGGKQEVAELGKVALSE